MRLLIYRLSESLLAVGIALIVGLLFINVVLRYGFNSGLAASEDISRLTFIFMVLLGAVVGVADRTHLGTTVIVNSLPQRWRPYLAGVGHLLAVFAFLMLAYGSFGQARANAGVLALGYVRYPLAWIYYAGMFCGIACAVVATWKAVETIRTRGFSSLRAMAASEDEL